MCSAYNKHMTLDERKSIENGLSNGSTKTAIATVLGKDKSSICKEIKKHSYDVRTNHFGRNPKGTYDCSKTEQCGFKEFCPNPCNHFEKISCKRRDKKVGVCNGCEQFKTCKLTKRIYKADKAHDEYIFDLHDSREGVNLTTSQAKQLGDKIKELVDQGQSPYAVVSAYPDLGICEKTIYNYISDGVFSQSGLYDIDLRLKTSRKLPKKKVKSKPREDKKYLIGRNYDDYKLFMNEHPSAHIVEMDTVYNDVSNGPFIQTFHFTDYNLMIGIYHERKTAESMLKGVKQVMEALGDLAQKFVTVILTDRGSEFVLAESMESLGVKVFFCDPMCAWQKPHCENNHRLIRYICPKEKDLHKLGLRSQEDLNLIFSHINSYPRKEKFGKTPFEELEFYHPDIFEKILDGFKLTVIDKKSVNLSPSLIKK